MKKHANKKNVKRTHTSDESGFEPIKMTFAVSALSVISLLVLAALVAY